MGVANVIPVGIAASRKVDSDSRPLTDPLWRCPKCGGPMAVIERLTAAQLQLRSPPPLVTTAA
jgi:hypothetical protein